MDIESHRCNAAGVDTSKVEIVPVDECNEFGLRAVSSLDEHELIVEIPRKIMLTTESAVQDTVLGMPRHDRFAMISFCCLSLQPKLSRKIRSCEQCQTCCWLFIY